MAVVCGLSVVLSLSVCLWKGEHLTGSGSVRGVVCLCVWGREDKGLWMWSVWF